MRPQPGSNWGLGKGHRAVAVPKKSLIWLRIWKNDWWAIERPRFIPKSPQALANRSAPIENHSYGCGFPAAHGYSAAGNVCAFATSAIRLQE